MKKMLGLVGLWLALLLGGGGVAPGVAEAKEDSQGIKVERRTYPVKLSDGKTYQVVGYLYYQGSLKNRPVQVLVHGITYDHAYWDLPDIQGETYSYARFMARQQYAVLALDLPGYGESSRPNGDFLNLAESVSALHQVMVQLRAKAERNTFEKLIYVGHSNGALISTYAQALHRDAQAVVLTGWLNTFHELPVGEEVISPLLQQGPYVTVPAALRTGLFYDVAHANPAVIAYDNAYVADTTPRGQLMDLFTLLADPTPIPTQKLTVPVLVQLGENDAVAPAAFAAQEARAYPRSPFVFVDPIADIGHAFNGHTNRLRSWSMISFWLRLAVP
ncbi:alpha/beta hydrolase [Melittangium boletus]|uniref:alpha/beta hydrolase n=1 Tax=Melittangium boletus TaxID=83453 RepID=UPI003DA4CB48